MASVFGQSNALDTMKNYIFMGLGAIAIVINAITLLILIKDKALRSKSSFLISMIIACLSASAFTFGAGTNRVISYEILNNTTDAYHCFSMVFPFLYPFAVIAGGAFLFLGSLERMLAIISPVQFHKKWSDMKAWKLAFATHVLVILGVLIGINFAVIDLETVWSCTPPGIFGVQYIVACQIFNVICGSIGALFGLVSMMVGNYRIRKLPLLSGEAGRLKRKLHLSRSMILMSLFHLALAVVPNVMIVQDLMPTIRMANVNQRTPLNYAFCANTLSSFIALIIFSSQFRQVAAKLSTSKCKESVNVWSTRSVRNQVHPGLN